MKKMFVLFLTCLLCFSSLPVSADTEDTYVDDWDYYNSILVTVQVEEARKFTPDDFPEIACTDVVTIRKSKTEHGYIYDLILVICKSDNHPAYSEENNDYALGYSIAAIMQNPFVIKAQTNHYGNRTAKLELSHSFIYLKVGESIDLNIKKINWAGPFLNYVGISFTVDKEIIDIDFLQKNSFEQYGVTHFWPETEKGESILYEQPSNLEGQKSETGKYYGLVDLEKDTLFDVVNCLVKVNGILSTEMIVKDVMGGDMHSEIWSIGNSDIAKITLSGGEKPGYAETLLNQTATIEGIKPGITNIYVTRSGGLGSPPRTNCAIFVYLPGDIDKDGVVTSNDALAALKHSVGLDPLNLDDQHFADMDDNGVIDAFDALAMLQISVGKDK